MTAFDKEVVLLIFSTTTQAKYHFYVRNNSKITENDVTQVNVILHLKLTI